MGFMLSHPVPGYSNITTKARLKKMGVFTTKQLKEITFSKYGYLETECQDFDRIIAIHNNTGAKLKTVYFSGCFKPFLFVESGE